MSINVHSCVSHLQENKSLCTSIDVWLSDHLSTDAFGWFSEIKDFIFLLIVIGFKAFKAKACIWSSLIKGFLDKFLNCHLYLRTEVGSLGYLPCCLWWHYSQWTCLEHLIVGNLQRFFSLLLMWIILDVWDNHVSKLNYFSVSIENENGFVAALQTSPGRYPLWCFYSIKKCLNLQNILHLQCPVPGSSVFEITEISIDWCLCSRNSCKAPGLTFMCL